MIIICVSGLIFIPVVGLTCFHIALIATGRTTNEQVTDKFKGSINPFTNGIIKNWVYMLCKSQYPRSQAKITTCSKSNKITINIKNSSENYEKIPLTSSKFFVHAENKSISQEWDVSPRVVFPAFNNLNGSISHKSSLLPNEMNHSISSTKSSLLYNDDVELLHPDSHWINGSKKNDSKCNLYDDGSCSVILDVEDYEFADSHHKVNLIKEMSHYHNCHESVSDTTPVNPFVATKTFSESSKFNRSVARDSNDFNSNKINKSNKFDLAPRASLETLDRFVSPPTSMSSANHSINSPTHFRDQDRFNSNALTNVKVPTRSAAHDKQSTKSSSLYPPFG